MEFAPVYLYSATKTVINSKYDLNKSFQEILNRINNRSNEGSGWVIESVDAEYMNISLFSPLSGSTYIKLPRRLRNSVKSLIIIKNSNNKCFLWCHIRHLNPLKIHPERIKKSIKIWLTILIMKALIFLSLGKILAILKRKIMFELLCFW